MKVFQKLLQVQSFVLNIDGSILNLFISLTTSDQCILLQANLFDFNNFISWCNNTIIIYLQIDTHNLKMLPHMASSLCQW